MRTLRALPSTLRRGIGAWLAATVAFGGLAVATSPAASANDAEPIATRTLSGAYVGARNLTGLKNFETFRGATASIATDFVDGSTWSTIANPTWLMSGWRNTGYHVAYAVPMLPATGGSIQEGATGAYNASWKTLATNLVAYSEQDAIVRIGWEMNGTWMRWSAVDDPAAYVAYWRQIVDTMRSVPGQDFVFEWAPNLGQGAAGFNKESAYPGDAYVDLVGASVYDQSWSLNKPGDEVKRWTSMVTMSGGMQWQADFARAHGKRASLSEWGLSQRCDGNGGGDDPYFVEQILKFADANDYYYESYFNRNMSECEVHQITNGPFEAARTAYQGMYQPRPVVVWTPPAPEPVLTVDSTLCPIVKLSYSSNRSNAVQLQGQTVRTGKAYIFVAPPTTPTVVTFWLDDPTMAGAPKIVEKGAPWDLMGGASWAANPFDTSTLTAGTHTLTVRLDYANAPSQLTQVTFTR
ncbi:glycoside hydrolase family 26 protein [Cellulomonas marina]|uniref:Glycosyl hydrolase family 26 n=1 Tax=Cellulomonas marina TaxID=988821 RepID=A0A1I0X124_9CELL|nr:glycosyl hydrolase [Cellulomonas marina]GIG29363.1 hypothetical protein Cma02nite_19630 [Cellulomonas marina]SFA94534.1 Glycosyl hydrolase family 26 [Cellulomonas marina]